MAGNLTSVAEALALNYLTGQAQTAPVLPLTVALITTATPSTTALVGSEVVAGGNAYARQNLTAAAVAGSNPASVSNSNTLTWTNMPTAIIGGIEVFDSSGTPRRIWFSTLAVNKSTAAGDTFQIGVGQLTLTGL